MPAVARMNGIDSVFSPHGTGKKCKFPTTQTTLEGSSKVFSMGIGVVRSGDSMIIHPNVGCTPHEPTLSTSSFRVFVEGKGIGRLGDRYGADHPIISGSPRVFAG